MGRKLVDRENIKFILDELFYIKLASPEHLQERIQNLITFVDSKILESDKSYVNELKGIYYKAMKEAKTPEENKYYYDLYKGLDKLQI